MSTNGIVRSAKTTSCSASHSSISASIAAQPSPSFDSSTRCWSFKSAAWSIISASASPLSGPRPFATGRSNRVESTT